MSDVEADRIYDAVGVKMFREEFRAWLAQHDAEVAAKSLRDAAAKFRDILNVTTLGMPTDEWLRDEAERILQEATK